MHDDIRRVAAHINTREMETSAPIKDIRAKRMAPLGIIGSISKSLFGLITTDDADVINKNIDQLFRDQKNLVKLTTEKTHLLSAGLEELYNITASHRNLIKKMEMALNTNINSLAKGVNDNHLTREFTTFARQIEATLDHLIYCNRQLLEILNTVTDRKLHPRLMRHDMLHQIPLDIQQMGEDRTLPMPLHHLRAEEVARIAHWMLPFIKEEF